MMKTNTTIIKKENTPLNGEAQKINNSDGSFSKKPSTLDILIIQKIAFPNIDTTKPNDNEKIRDSDLSYSYNTQYR